MRSIHKFRAAWLVFACVQLLPVLAANSQQRYMLQYERKGLNALTSQKTTTNDFNYYLEFVVADGEEFYSRTVAGEAQVMLRGKFERSRLDYTLSEALLGRATPAPLVATGSVHLSLASPIASIANNNDNETVQRRLSLRPFVKGVGARDVSSAFSIRVLDQIDTAVTNAHVSFLDATGECVMGPLITDKDGFVRVTEGRESLPELRIKVENKARNSSAMIVLDRTVLRGATGYGQPFEIRVKN